jgi:hypothetical protein
MTRPLVLVYQDLAASSVEPSVPDLNSVIVGPAYVVKDYPDDATSILLDTKYGALEAPAGGTAAYSPPLANTPAITVVAYPGNAPGAAVDHASVTVVLQNPHIVIGATYGDPTVMPPVGTKIVTSTTVGLENKVVFTGGDLVAAGVQVGDRLVMTDSGGSNTIVGTIASIGEPDAHGVVTDVTALRLAANVPATGWIADANGEARIERVLSDRVVVDAVGNVVTFPYTGTDTLVLNGGVTVTVGAKAYAVSYAGVYVSYRALRQDLASDVDFATANDVLIDALGRTYFAKIGLVDARNPLAAGVWLALQSAGTAPIYFVGVAANDASGHIQARAVTESRRDLWAFVPMTDNLSIHGSYKLEWDQLASPNYALTNGVEQKFRAVLASTALPVNTTIAPASVTGVAQPPTTTTNTGLKRTLVFHGTPTIDVSQVVVGDQVTIGLVPAGGSWSTRRGTHSVAHVNKSTDSPTAGDYPTIELLPGTARWNDAATDASGGCEILIKTPGNPVPKVSKLASLQIDDGSNNGVKFQMLVPTVNGGPYTIAYAAGATLAVSIVGFAITVTVPAGTTYDQIAAAVNAHVAVSQLLVASRVGTNAAQATTTVAAAPVAVSSTLCAASVAPNDDLVVWLFDANAKFLTQGVKVGDVVQIPVDPNNYLASAFDGQLLSYTVAQVISENRLQVAILGDDTPSAANELPHAYNRTLAGRYIDDETASTLSAQNYRVVRTLTTDDQVNTLITVAQSLKSKRATMVWPDLCDVDGLKDGSQPRDPATPFVASPALAQPGCYIACVIAGALAGLPVQRGLTRLGLPGIKKLYHTTRYFREAQLSKLSDGGLFVMHQKTLAALPECIHQLTTDVTAVETGELSVVRNVDYVSIVLQNVIDPFLGQWNVLPETLSEIFNQMSRTITDLKSRKIAQIGAPLVSAEISSLKVSDVAANRVVTFVNAKVPIPLNGVDLHLVV